MGTGIFVWSFVSDAALAFHSFGYLLHSRASSLELPPIVVPPQGVPRAARGSSRPRKYLLLIGRYTRGRPKSLVLYGESRLGKTLWARSLGRHVYNCLQFNVDDMRADLDEALYAVFDDMQGGFKFFPSYKGWLGAQSKFTVTDKYRGKTSIQWGRPTIWICNESPSEWTDVDMRWLNANCIFVEIRQPIFRASTD